MASYKWPASGGGSGSGVSIYANLAGFPAATAVSDGTLAVAADTNIVYESDGATWSAIASGAAYTNAAGATSLNTISTVVKRDGSGNFAAGTITAALTGNVAGNLTGNVTGNLTGTVTGHSTLDLPLTGGTMSGALAMGGNKVTGLGAPTVNGDALRYDQLGANSGIATLDSGGKVPLAQLPASLMEYQGTWNATTNTPTLADGTGTSGYFYRVQTAGTQNLGSGSQTFVVGDWVMYNGSVWQLAHSGADAVLSVNGAAGVVTVNAINQLTGDVTAAAATGSQSKASALVATTNATLTTLSALTTAASLASVGTITSGTWSGTTIALNKGGTGQTGQTAAFDALSPNTTKGDVAAHNGTNNIRVAVGVNGQVLTADSAQTPGLKWADPAATAGEVNAVLNPYATSLTTGWAGDAVAHTVLRNTANSPLDPAITTCFAITASANAVEGSTAGVGYTISTFPAGLRGRKNKVEFWITSPSADTWKVSVYTAGGVRQALSTDSSSATTITAGVTGKFTTTFDADASTTSYIVRFTRTGGTGTTTLYVTNLVVGPGIQPQGGAVSKVAFVPTFDNLSSVSTAITAVRTGSQVRVHGNIAPGSTAGSNAAIVLPSTMTIDTTDWASGGSVIVGRWDRRYSGASANLEPQQGISGVLFYDGSIANKLFFATNAGTGAFVKLTGTTISTDWVSFEFTLPIAEWAGGGTVNLAQNDIAYYYGTGGTWGTSATITTAQGPGGVLGGTTTPAVSRFDYTFVPTYPIPVGAVPQLQVSTDQIHWSPLGGNWAAGGISENLRFDGTNYIGMGVEITTSGNILVSFGKYVSGTSTAWSGTWYWRVAVALPGQAVGFAEVVPGTSSGLVSASGLKGRTDGGTVAAGYVGQVIATNATAVSVGTTATNVVGVTLTPGNWLILATIVGDGTTGAGYIKAGISTSASSFSGTMGLDTAFVVINAANGIGSGSFYKFVALSAATTAYYLTALQDVGTHNVDGSITAVRIA